MEELFEQLYKESSSSKLFIDIQKKSTQAKDLLESQCNLMRCSPSELRETCLKPLQSALETKQSKMVSLAISGLFKLLRDNQFHSDCEDLDETRWLPCQVLAAVQSLPAHSEDIQVELLKVILSMSCIPEVSMSGHITVQILGICGLAYGRGTPALRSVSQAAAVQSIFALLSHIRSESSDQEEEVERQQHLQDFNQDYEEQEEIYDFVAPAFDDLVPVINYIAEKLTEANKHKESKKEVDVPSLFLLECSNCIIEGLSAGRIATSETVCTRKDVLDKSNWQPPSYCSTLLVSALWQRLCPALIAFLGTPVSMRVSRGMGRTHGQMGRGSGTSSLPTLLFNSQESKVIYSIACNVVVAMGTVGEMRPVFESLFYRMLLYTPPSCRQDALRAVAEVLHCPEKLLQVAGPILHSDPRNHYQNDLSLFRLTMDSLIECSNLNDSEMQLVVMNCIAGLLSSVEELCEGKTLSCLHITAINNAFQSLRDVDYMGPLTYESHHVAEPKYEFSESLSSDVESEFPETASQHSESETEATKENLFVVKDIQKHETKEEEDNINDSDNDSCSSGRTEGPTEEETFESEQQQLMVEEEDARLQRLSESLETNNDELHNRKDEEQERERLNAQHFCATLQALLPSLLAIRSTIEVDEAVLEFSSKYCQGVFTDTAEVGKCPVIINADGIYLSTYAALSFNLKLIRSGFYYQRDETSLPMSQDQFMEWVFGSGVLVYLSSSWVGEVYQRVIGDSFLQRAGYNPHSLSNCALINLLTDLDGMGSIERGSQMLSDFRRLEKASKNIPNSASKDAGNKLCRRIMTCGWESILSILGTLLRRLDAEGGILAPIRLLLMGDSARKDEARRGQDTLILCLNALQSMARLANTLGLQKRSGVVFSLLSSACLPKDERNPLSTPRRCFHSSSIAKRQLKLHTAHVLSFHVMMSAGLELGSHAPECWSHIFRCCLYMAELERKFFSGSESLLSFSPFGNSSAGTQKEHRGSASSEELFTEDYSTAHVSPSSQATTHNLEELLSECQDEASSSGFLSTQTSGKALCCLTLLIDKFFDSAASQLNLEALVGFLRELCRASHAQLFSRVGPSTPKKGFLNWSRLKKGPNSSSHIMDAGFVEEALLLHRLGEVMLKVVRSGRPLIHIMRIWAVVGPHFLKAACHRDGAVSKKAICCIHDTVNALLGSQIELPHFHFNEALFKPFENLLCLELCDIEVQDQIVSSICEFVESCNSEIRSGWRPLFGALRCVRAVPVGLPRDFHAIGGCHETVGHLRAVKDVFEAFLSTDNVLVFANASLDCILCLLKHVKGLSEGEQVTEIVVCWGELVGGDLCLDALRYIHRCAVILSSMYMMPACPVFHSVHRINVTNSQHLVDCHIPGIDENYLWSLIKDTLACEEKVDYSPLWPGVEEDGARCLQELDDGSGLLQVWYVLLEGLAGAVVTCPRRHQPQVLDTLFILMRSLPDCPGPTFGLYCINHLLLPLMQNWLRRSSEAQSLDWEGTLSFKQYTGLTSDLVVDYLKRPSIHGGDEIAKRLMLQQCLIVLVECVSCPSEVIARLGCSCIRHIALSCGDKLSSSSMWDVLVCSLHRASQISLYPLYLLMKMFCPESANFYGDIGQVKVAARRDCTGRDTDRLRQISHQVFLLDSQRTELSSVEENPDSEDRSFIFLLYPASAEGLYRQDKEITPQRVPFRAVVVGLLASQMIIQTLGQILVKGSPHIVPSLANVLLQASDFSSSDGVCEKKGELPGLLQWLQPSHVLALLDSLRLSYEASVQFDRRPGLKFLIQKVAQSERAANLYKEAGATWTLRMLTLFDLILSKVKHGLDLEKVKLFLDSEIARSKTVVKDESEVEMAEKKPFRPTSLLDSTTELYVRMLCKAFSELCEAYLELVSSRVDQGSQSDLIDNQPIFFLTIPADDFSTDHRKSLEKWSRNLNEFNKDYIKSKAPVKGSYEKETLDECVSSSLPAKMTLGASVAPYDEDEAASPVEERKSFSFADLAQALSSDEDEDENMSRCSKEGDSGVASVAGIDQSVYTLATEKDISAVVGDYRRRKNRHALPSQVPSRRFNPFVESPKQQSFRPSESIPPEIEEQRSGSLLKDSEAHLKVWTEMVVTVFDLVSQLKDAELRPLLPLVFPTVRSLTAHAHDPHLRQVVAEMLNRVACLYGFSPAE